MTRFVVFEPPADGGKAPAGMTERAVFLRDAFSIWAFLFPVLWLLRYGLFLSALVVFLLCFGLAQTVQPGFALLAIPLLGLLVALEGPQLRARRYLRRRYRETAVVEAATASEAEILYYAAGGIGAAPGGRAAEKALPWRFEPSPRPAPRRWWRRGASKAAT